MLHLCKKYQVSELCSQVFLSLKNFQLKKYGKQEMREQLLCCISYLVSIVTVAKWDRKTENINWNKKGKIPGCCLEVFYKVYNI